MDLRRIAIALAAGFAGFSLLLSGLAPAAAEGESGTASAGTSAEAWYVTGACEAPAPDCSPADAPPPAPVPVPAPVPASAYPENTLHVAINAGRPTASTFLALDTSAVPFGSDITGGTLTLPVDRAREDGSIAPESGKLVACVVTEPIEEKEGSPSKPPKSDCKRSSPARFTGGKDPAFTVDLTAFAAEWADGGDAQLAIHPAPAATEERDTWHVTFWGKDNKTTGAKPISAQLTYRASEEDILPPLDSEFGAVAAPLDTGMAAPPPPLEAQPLDGPAPQPAVPPGGSAKPEAAGQPESPQVAPAMRQVGYPQKIAWLMPLGVLVGYGLTGLALTKKLDPTRLA